MSKAQELLDQLEALKPLAGSSDKAKYANIRKQLDDLDQQKQRYLDAMATEKDDAKRAAAQKSLHALRDKQDKLLDLRHDMLNKFRGLRGSK